MANKSVHYESNFACANREFPRHVACQHSPLSALTEHSVLRHSACDSSQPSLPRASQTDCDSVLLSCLFRSRVFCTPLCLTQFGVFSTLVFSSIWCLLHTGLSYSCIYCTEMSLPLWYRFYFGIFSIRVSYLYWCLHHSGISFTLVSALLWCHSNLFSDL